MAICIFKNEQGIRCPDESTQASNYCKTHHEAFLRVESSQQLQQQQQQQQQQAVGINRAQQQQQ
jgi:hypothetical protein